jgi:hypothetical protein
MGMNATMINLQATRLETGQRDKFKGRFSDLTSGGSSRDLSSLFPGGPLSEPTDSFSDTKKKFTELYTDGIVIGTDIQPDFVKGYSANQFKYYDGNSKFDDVENATDKPTYLGPNMKSLSIDSNGEPIIPSDREPSPAPANIDVVENGRGFGSSFNRNNPTRASSVSDHYVNRKEEPSSITLGEYIDIANYGQVSSATLAAAGLESAASNPLPDSVVPGIDPATRLDSVI